MPAPFNYRLRSLWEAPCELTMFLTVALNEIMKNIIATLCSVGFKVFTWDLTAKQDHESRRVTV